MGFVAMDNEKIIDVLKFEKGGKLRFGAPIFDFGSDSVRSRLIIEYKEDASVRVNYDAYQKMIVLDHLVPQEGNTSAKDTYVPDGTYEGFELKKGRWIYVEKVFTFSINHPDNPPMPNPKLDK